MRYPDDQALLERWIYLAKGHRQLYVEFGRGGGRCHQWSAGIEARATNPIELRFDLDLNLRVRSKSGNQYLDARTLADGAIGKLELLQWDDEKALTRLRSLLRDADHPKPPWRLTVLLQGEHQFMVDPEAPPDWPGRVYLWVLDSAGQRVSEWGRKRD
jgi:hypothetical protein